MHVGVSGFAANLPGIHLNFILIVLCRDRLHDDRGHDHRPADAAPARRLHRDRDARVRRDHRPPGRQLRRGQVLEHADPRRPARQLLRRGAGHHRGKAGHHAGGQDRLPGPGPVHVARAQAVVLDRARAGRDRAVRELPAARLAARAGVDRPARGRGGRRVDGRPGGQDEAAGLRHRRGVRRHGGRLPRLVPEHRQRRPVPVLLLDPDPRHGHPRRPRLDLGRRAGRDRPVVHQQLADPGRAERRAEQARASTST